MRTLLLLLISFILVITLQQCNNSNDDLLTNKSNQVSNDTLDNDPVPCCNAGIPPNCDPSYTVSIMTDCGDKLISCECCLDFYAYYGYPDRLPIVPCFEPGISGCFPNKDQ